MNFFFLNHWWWLLLSDINVFSIRGKRHLNGINVHCSTSDTDTLEPPHFDLFTFIDCLRMYTCNSRTSFSNFRLLGSGIVHWKQRRLRAKKI